MIKGITQGGRYINVQGGQPPSMYINNFSGAQGVGNIRYNTVNQNLEIYDGNNWVQYSVGYASIGLTGEAESLLDWAAKKRDAEMRAIELAKTNPTIADALETARHAQEQLDIVMALTKVNE